MTAFTHFKGIYELKDCSWIVEDEYYKNVVEPELDKMKHTKYMAEFMFKCTYPNEKPLSKKDYGRTRFTHSKICDKMSTLAQVRTESEDDAFQRGCRNLNIQQKMYGIFSWNEVKDSEFVRDYVDKGVIKKGYFKFARQIGLI